MTHHFPTGPPILGNAVTKLAHGSKALHNGTSRSGRAGRSDSVGHGRSMQSITRWLSEFSFGDPALWVALAAGLGVVLAFLLLGHRPSPSRLQSPFGPAQPPGDWVNPPAVARHDERRRSIRRAGLPTPINVTDAKTGRKARQMEAYVVDRSTGGLRLALEKPHPVGTTLHARPASAGDDFVWVKLLVRNCKETGDYFEVGCQFESELELSRLLMFG